MPPTPTPSPWKSLARFTLRSLYALLLATALWSLWYAYAAHHLNAKLAEYRARGEPASLQDFVGKPVPPSDNAYSLAIAAAESLTLTADEQELVDSPTSVTPTMLPLSPQQMVTARTMVSDHAPTLDLIRQASLARYCVSPFDTQKIDNNLHGLGQFRRVANFLRIVAFFHHQDRRDDLVLKDILHIHMLATVASAGHFLIHHLVSIAIDDLASRAMLHMAPDFSLKLVGDSYGASREQTLQMAMEFLDQDQFQEDLRSSFRNERIYNSVYINAVLSFSDTWMLPLFRLDAVRSMELTDSRIHAVSPGRPPYPVVQAHLPEDLEPNSNLQDAAHLVSGGSLGLNKAILLHYRAMTDREAAGLSLLLRLYELDHAGQLPPRLADLIPAYLSALPSDPFRKDGDTFVYDATRHIFYSVGENGIDDGGVAASRIFPNWREKDTVYSLDPPLPPPPPLPAPTEGNDVPAAPAPQ